MSSAPLETRVSALDQALLELARAQARSQTQLDQLSQEMRVFKDEMVVFRDEMRLGAERTNKQLGELSNELLASGTRGDVQGLLLNC